MDKNKSKELTYYILNNQDINSTNDVANALKDMFGCVIQNMMLLNLIVQWAMKRVII